jgi:23S rRNA pseudouridine955/2504/2580 synthase
MSSEVKETQETKIGRYLIVDEEHASRRIDNFLFTQLKVPKRLIYRLLRQGAIRVNKKRVHPDYRLQTNDSIRLVRFEAAIPPDKIEVSPSLESLLSNHILYESDGLLVINKPSGLAVHGGSGVSVGLIEALRKLRLQDRFLELVHRLDRDTSGCLLIAKKPSVLRELHRQLREGAMTKTYKALTLGHWSKAVNRASAHLKKNILVSGERIVKVDEEGKLAESEFRVMQSFSHCELVDVILLTGRTHQIRVHAQYFGHPVAGDEKYGDAAFNRLMKSSGLNRLFLHAETIVFNDPVSHEPVFVKAPMDEILTTVLKQLQGK